MSEPTNDELLGQIGNLLSQGKLEEATVIADTLKKRTLELLREGKGDEARKLMAPIMLLPPDRKFLTEYAALLSDEMSEQ
jgi:hypothetical protein